jgi:hypothetical protein
MFIYIHVYTILILLLLLIGIIPLKIKLIAKVYNFLRKMFIYNSILRLLIEGYLELTICTLVNLYDISYQTFTDIY